MNLGGKFDIGTSAGTYKATDGSEAKVNLDVHAGRQGSEGPSRPDLSGRGDKY